MTKNTDIKKIKISLEEAKKSKGKTNFAKLLVEQNKEKAKKQSGN